ncbi:MAG: chorismate synthase [Candidatus Delongbacteria bacterium]|nr:chorismate synthase [Candidatus Delongbacteria bacterium]
MNTFGRLFRISILGESHGDCIGVVIDGCRPGLELSESSFTADLARRKSGQPGTTARLEPDQPIIRSGVFNGRTTGAPILIEFLNTNTRSGDYRSLIATPRPGQADLTARCKYNTFHDFRGGGHFSGRLTLALVAAGVIARLHLPAISIQAHIQEIGGLRDYQDTLAQAQLDHDSLGGIIECQTSPLPIGLGEPFFDSIESLISHLVFSIPGIKAIEFGSGFRLASMPGHLANDPIIQPNGTTLSNHAGGINGGISNGNPIVFRVAVKPTPSIGRKQSTLNLETRTMTELEIQGRHDACFALRVPVILESVTAVVLADLMAITQSNGSLDYLTQSSL